MMEADSIQLFESHCPTSSLFGSLLRHERESLSTVCSLLTHCPFKPPLPPSPVLSPQEFPRAFALIWPCSWWGAWLCRVGPAGICRLHQSGVWSPHLRGVTGFQIGWTRSLRRSELSPDAPSVTFVIFSKKKCLNWKSQVVLPGRRWTAPLPKFSVLSLEAGAGDTDAVVQFGRSVGNLSATLAGMFLGCPAA